MNTKSNNLMDKKLNPLSSEEDLGDNKDNDDYDEDDNQEEKLQDQEESSWIYETSLLVVATLVYYIEFILIPFVMIIVGLVSPLMKIEKQSCFFMCLVGLWIILSNLSILYMQYILFYSKIEDNNLRYMYADSMFFYLNAVLVFAFIKAKQSKITNFGQIFKNICQQKSFSTFQYLHEEGADKGSFLFDFPESRNKPKSLKDNGVSNLSRRYKLFDFHKASRKDIPNNIFDLDEITEFHKYRKPQFEQYFILIGILVIKIFLAFKYLNFVGNQFDYKQLLDIFVNIFLYFYTAFNLNRILGNYDLRKKQEALDILSNQVRFRDLKKENMKEEIRTKIDFTCTVSMETWDNYRKVILSSDNEFMQVLEVSYFCLFFYFVFVTLIVFSSFFELYWIFEKESILLNPILVIESSFDFVFLSFFLLFRFYYGTKYNDTFDDMLQNLRSLSDVVDDLITMYDYYFDCIFLDENQKPVSETVENIYGVVIKKIKLMSREFIEKNEQLDGIVYDKTTESLGKLRRKLLESIRKSVKKIIRSVENDKSEYKYLFLNLIEVNFQDIFTSLAITLITTLPTIVPKFIGFYSPDEPEKPKDPKTF